MLPIIIGGAKLALTGYSCYKTVKQVQSGKPLTKLQLASIFIAPGLNNLSFIGKLVDTPYGRMDPETMTEAEKLIWKDGYHRGWGKGFSEGYHWVKEKFGITE